MSARLHQATKRKRAAEGGLPTVKIRITVAYDGTNYAGWQVQKTGIGVQEKIEAVVHRYFPGASRLHGSSRTDTGVHALGMVAHVEIPSSEWTMSASKLVLALNAFLPEDIRILESTECGPDFHARFDARGKQYRYLIWNHAAMNPLLRTQAWHVPNRLDLVSMRRAAQQLLGKHDFKSFAATRNYEMESTVRTLTRCDIQRRGPLLTVIIEGDGFLYKMCRGIVGTLVELGRGKFDGPAFTRMVAARDRRAGGMTAPAHGLVLWEVFYDKRKSDTARAAKGTRMNHDP